MESKLTEKVDQKSIDESKDAMAHTIDSEMIENLNLLLNLPLLEEELQWELLKHLELIDRDLIEDDANHRKGIDNE